MRRITLTPRKEYHIEQFDLVQKEEEQDKRLFEEAVFRDKSHIEESHLLPFKEVEIYLHVFFLATRNKETCQINVRNN